MGNKTTSSSYEFTELCCDVLDSEHVWTLLDSALQQGG